MDKNILKELNRTREIMGLNLLSEEELKTNDTIKEDIEEMEQLGIFECDEEDFALCSFACPSKIDLGQAIRDGLNLIESES